MTDLVQTALEFCRECLGHADVEASGGDIVRPVRESMVMIDRIARYREYELLLRPSDVNAVMAATTGWHRRHGLFLSVYSFPEIDGFCVTVFDALLAVDCEHQTLCHALMSACVQASRKLKAATPGP